MPARAIIIHWLAADFHARRQRGQGNIKHKPSIFRGIVRRLILGNQFKLLFPLKL